MMALANGLVNLASTGLVLTKVSLQGIFGSGQNSIKIALQRALPGLKEFTTRYRSRNAKGNWMIRFGSSQLESHPSASAKKKLSAGGN